MKIITPRHRVKRIETWHEFRYKNDPNSGFSCPVVNGKDYVKEGMRENYEYCLSHPELFNDWIQEFDNSYTEPAVGKCSCGRTVTLVDTYMGATDCGCGRWYNMFGQELLPPKYWEDEA